jgi:hypothetical protein
MHDTAVVARAAARLRGETSLLINAASVSKRAPVSDRGTVVSIKKSLFDELSVQERGSPQRLSKGGEALRLPAQLSVYIVQVSANSAWGDAEVAKFRRRAANSQRWPGIGNISVNEANQEGRLGAKRGLMSGGDTAARRLRLPP